MPRITAEYTLGGVAMSGVQFPICRRDLLGLEIDYNTRVTLVINGNATVWHWADLQQISSEPNCGAGNIQYGK